jgi:hypothetical protein
MKKEELTMAKYKIEGTKQYVDPDKMLCLSQDGILNYNGCTRNEILYMTKRSKRFFILSSSMWQGEHDSVREVSKSEAYEFVAENEDIDDANKIISQYFEECRIFEELE